jgi:hypothetical protein
MKRFVHPNGSVEDTPPHKHDVVEVKDNHESSIQSRKTNRLAYKVANQSDPYKYKFYQMDE